MAVMDAAMPTGEWVTRRIPSPEPEVIEEAYSAFDDRVRVYVWSYPVAYRVEGLVLHAGGAYQPAQHDPVGEDGDGVFATIAEARAVVEGVAMSVVKPW